MTAGLGQPPYVPDPTALHYGYEDYQGQHGDEWKTAEPKIPLDELMKDLLDTQHLEVQRDNLQMLRDLHIVECLKEVATIAGEKMETAIENKLNSLNMEIKLAQEQNHVKSVQAGWHETNARNGAISTPSGIAHPNPQNPQQWNFHATQGMQYQQPWGPPPQPHHSVAEVGKGFFTKFVESKTGVNLGAPPAQPGPYGPPPPGWGPPPPRSPWGPPY